MDSSAKSALSLDAISISNLSLPSTPLATFFPPLTNSFAQNLTGLQEAVRKSGDQQVQLAFVQYLLEAAKIVVYEPSQLGVKFPESCKQTEEEWKNNLQDFFTTQAIKLLKRLALNGGFGRPPLADAQFQLAEYFGRGDYGIEVDHKKAFMLYMQASKQGHSIAAFRVAACYELGAGTKRDMFRAVQFYRKAAALGEPLAMHKMALILLYGKLGQERRPKEGLQWLKQAARDASESHPEALYNLALCYTKEEGLSIVIPDEQYAFELFKQAADLGYKPAQYRTGMCYEFGSLECPQDAVLSIKYYSMAAEQGHAESQLSLANWFLNGAPEANLAQSDVDAYRWARKAADSGHFKAQYMVGHCFECSIGVPKDMQEAKHWYELAAKQGYQRAKQRLEDLENRNGRERKSSCRYGCTIQ